MHARLQRIYRMMEKEDVKKSSVVAMISMAGFGSSYSATQSKRKNNTAVLAHEEPSKSLRTEQKDDEIIISSLHSLCNRLEELKAIKHLICKINYHCKFVLLKMRKYGKTILIGMWTIILLICAF